MLSKIINLILCISNPTFAPCSSSISIPIGISSFLVERNSDPFQKTKSKTKPNQNQIKTAKMVSPHRLKQFFRSMYEVRHVIKMLFPFPKTVLDLMKIAAKTRIPPRHYHWKVVVVIRKKRKERNTLSISIDNPQTPPRVQQHPHKTWFSAPHQIISARIRRAIPPHRGM